MLYEGFARPAIGTPSWPSLLALKAQPSAGSRIIRIVTVDGQNPALPIIRNPIVEGP